MIDFRKMTSKTIVEEVGDALQRLDHTGHP